MLEDSSGFFKTILMLYNFAFLHAYWYRFLVDAKIYEHEKLGGEFKPTGALK